MALLSSRRSNLIAQAAAPVFLAKGFARTTMRDIATAADISRQGLYLIFPDKEAVFSATVRWLNDGLIAEITGALAQIATTEARLVFACEHWLAAVYDLQLATPDARDMDDLRFAVVREVYDRFVALVADMLGAEMPMDGNRSELARILVFAIRGFSSTATAGTEMRRLAAVQIRMMLIAIRSGETAMLESPFTPPLLVAASLRDHR